MLILIIFVSFISIFKKNVFYVLWQWPSTCLPFSFLWFSLCGPLGWRSLLFARFTLLLFYSLRVFHISVSCCYFTWQQVFSSLQGSQYSGRSQQCCSLDGLHPSTYFQIFLSFYHSFGDCTKSTNYNCYKHHFHVTQFFLNSLARLRYLSLFLLSFNFTLWSAKFAIRQVLLFVDYHKIWTSGRDLVIRLYLKIPEEFVRLVL